MSPACTGTRCCMCQCAHWGAPGRLGSHPCARNAGSGTSLGFLTVTEALEIICTHAGVQVPVDPPTTGTGYRLQSFPSGGSTSGCQSLPYPVLSLPPNTRAMSHITMPACWWEAVACRTQSPCLSGPMRCHAWGFLTHACCARPRRQGDLRRAVRRGRACAAAAPAARNDNQGSHQGLLHVTSDTESDDSSRAAPTPAVSPFANSVRHSSVPLHQHDGAGAFC